MIGETVGHFRVLRQLGRGGMGEVWLAEHEAIKTKVAIKMLLPHISVDKQQVQRFFNEAIAVGKIKHSGIAKIFDVGFLPTGDAYLVMEFLDGESLGSRIARSGRLAVGQIADVGRQIASVLEATHAEGITHRDLKPDNVFLVRDAELDSGERVKVLDFGIAKLGDSTMGLTGASSMGTPSYMSPEQWKSSAKVDGRADLYSLGCLAFEMACGRPPFVSGSIGEACQLHLNEPPPAARSLVGDLPPELDALLTRLLAKEPDQRPAVRDVKAAFTVIGEHAPRPLDATMAATGDTLAAAAKRATGEVTPARVASTPTGPGQVAVAVTNPATVASAPPPVARSSRLPWLLGAGALAAAIGVVVFGMLHKPAATGPRTVRGSAVKTSVQANKITDVPVDFADVRMKVPEVLVPDCSASSNPCAVRTIAGTGWKDGTFRIDDVPAGPYYLKTGSTYVVTSSDTIDISWAAHGRPDQVDASPDTGITLALTNLDPWKTGDVLEMFAEDADTWWFESHYLPDGATAMPADALGNPFRNLLAAQGQKLIQDDRLTVTQLSRRTSDNGLAYLVASRSSSAPLSQTAGSSTAVTRELAPLPATNRLVADVRRSEWDAAAGYDGTHALRLNPEAVPAAHVTPDGPPGLRIGVATEPGPALYGSGTSADLLLATLPPGSADLAVDLHYAPIPMAGTWTSILSASEMWEVPYQLPGTTKATTVTVRLGWADLLSAAPGPIQPMLGPVQAPTVSGHDLFQAQTGVESTPMIAWRAPALGNPTLYGVTVVHLTHMNIVEETTFNEPVATIETTETSVAVPPGILLAGEPYVIEIWAYDGESLSAPFRQSFPQAYASVASAMITIAK